MTDAEELQELHKEAYFKNILDALQMRSQELRELRERKGKDKDCPGVKKEELN